MDHYIPATEFPRNYSVSNSELICLAQETKTKGEERAWKRGRRAAAGQKRLMEEFSDAI